MIKLLHSVGSVDQIHRISTEFVRSVCPEEYVRLDVLLSSPSAIETMLEIDDTDRPPTPGWFIIEDIKRKFSEKTHIEILWEHVDMETDVAHNIPERYIWYALDVYQLKPAAIEIAEHITQEFMNLRV